MQKESSADPIAELKAPRGPGSGAIAIYARATNTDIGDGKSTLGSADAEVLLVARRRRGYAVVVGAGEEVAASQCWVAELERPVGVAGCVAKPDGAEAAAEALLHFHLHLP